MPAATVMPVNLLLPPDPILPTTDYRAPRAILGAQASAASPRFPRPTLSPSPSEVQLPGGFALNLMRGPGRIADDNMMVMVVCGGDWLEHQAIAITDARQRSAASVTGLTWATPWLPR